MVLWIIFSVNQNSKLIKCHLTIQCVWATEWPNDAKILINKRILIHTHYARQRTRSYLIYMQYYLYIPRQSDVHAFWLTGRFHETVYVCVWVCCSRVCLGGCMAYTFSGTLFTSAGDETRREARAVHSLVVVAVDFRGRRRRRQRSTPSLRWVADTQRRCCKQCICCLRAHWLWSSYGVYIRYVCVRVRFRRTSNFYVCFVIITSRVIIEKLEQWDTADVCRWTVLRVSSSQKALNVCAAANDSLIRFSIFYILLYWVLYTTAML